MQKYSQMQVVIAQPSKEVKILIKYSGNLSKVLKLVIICNYPTALIVNVNTN